MVSGALPHEELRAQDAEAVDRGCLCPEDEVAERDEGNPRGAQFVVFFRGEITFWAHKPPCGADGAPGGA